MRGIGILCGVNRVIEVVERQWLISRQGLCVGLSGCTKRGKDEGWSVGVAMCILVLLGKVEVTWWDAHDRS